MYHRLIKVSNVTESVKGLFLINTPTISKKIGVN